MLSLRLKKVIDAVLDRRKRFQGNSFCDDGTNPRENVSENCDSVF